MGKEVATGPTPGLGPFDKKIVRLFADRKSADEVSAELGGILSPAQCYARVTEILESRDALDVINQKRLVLEDAVWLSATMRKQMEEAGHVLKDDANAYRNLLKDIMGMIEQLNDQDAAMLSRISEAHARIMAQAIRVGYQTAILKLQQTYEISEAEAYEVLEASMPVAFESLTESK